MMGCERDGILSAIVITQNEDGRSLPEHSQGHSARLTGYIAPRQIYDIVLDTAILVQ